MRISQQEIDLLMKGLEPFIKNLSFELRLYGSRVHDNLKGGDIDLLLILEQDKQSLLEQKHYILASIKKYLGDQKIDLLITSQKELKTDSFLQLIFPQSILIANNI